MNRSLYRSGPAAWTPLALVSALSALTVAPSFAQPSNEKTLAPVVVTASRFEQPQTDALPHTTVITSEDIRNSQAQDLPTLLQREAGIQLTQSGGLGQPTSLFMRGATPAETLILIDGVPVRRQGFSAAPALEHILPEQIDRIEIVRGNVSAIYGSGAIGGVIQIFTKQGAGQPSVNLSGTVGSRDTRSLTAAVSGKSGDTRYALSATGFRTDGFSANNVREYPSENPDDDGYRNKSIAASISNEWAKGHEVGARIYANDGKFQYDGGGSGSPTDIANGRSEQQSIAVFSKNRLAPQWISTVTVSDTETQSENISSSPSRSSFSNNRDNSEATLLQWANEVGLSSNWMLITGIDGGRQKLDISSTRASTFGNTSTQNNYDRSISSVYLGVNGKMQAHQVQLNARHDRVGGSGSETTGFVGYGFSITPAVKLIANASTAFNAPTLTQLYDPVSGNPELRAEKSKSYELGAQYAANDVLFRGTLFNTRTRNQFSFDPDNCFSGIFPASCPTLNLNRATNEGIELSVTGMLAGVDTRLSLTFQNPEDDATGERLLRRAKKLGTLSLSKSLNAWRVGTHIQYIGSRSDKNFAAFPATDVELGSFWLVNLNARYQVSKNVSLFGRLDNAFDRDYQTVYGYNQAPRGVFAGVNWQM